MVSPCAREWDNRSGLISLRESTPQRMKRRGVLQTVGAVTKQEVQICQQPEESVLAMGKQAISAGCVHAENRAIRRRAAVKLSDRLNRRIEGLDREGAVDRRKSRYRSGQEVGLL